MTLVMGIENYMHYKDRYNDIVLVVDYDPTVRPSNIAMRAIDKGYTSTEVLHLIDNIVSKKRFVMAQQFHLYYGEPGVYHSENEFVDRQVKAGRYETDARTVWRLAALSE